MFEFVLGSLPVHCCFICLKTFYSCTELGKSPEVDLVKTYDASFFFGGWEEGVGFRTVLAVVHYS